jgi:hypothetical protein
MLSMNLNSNLLVYIPRNSLFGIVSSTITYIITIIVMVLNICEKFENWCWSYGLAIYCSGKIHKPC